MKILGITAYYHDSDAAIVTYNLQSGEFLLVKDAYVALES